MLVAAALAMLLNLRVGGNASVGQPRAAPIVVHISPYGSDRNEGTRRHPLRSVVAARDLVRERRRRQPEPSNATVWLRGGVYDMTGNGSLQLDARDSNTTWAAAGHVLLSGGFHVAKSKWTRPSASALERLPSATAHLVWQAEFEPQVGGAMGRIVGAGPPGSAPPWGVCANSENREIFFGRPNDQYQPGLLARYPNVRSDGTWMWETVSQPCGTSPTCQTNITAANLSTARLQRWTREPELWLQTYFEWDWANALVRVTGIDPVDKLLRISAETCAQHTPTVNSRWLAINALSELDTEGEYYLMRNESTALFIPPYRASDIVLSDAPTIVNGTGLQNVRFEGISMQFARGTAVSCGPTGSADGVCHRFTVTDAEVANIGEQAVAIDGYQSGLVNVSVHGTGCQGVDVRGGETRSLTSGRSFVLGSTISNASRWHRTYTPHIRIGGVGNIYSNNTLFNGPHSAMVGGCNDCLISGNIFRRFLHETADAGAFYDGRTWVHRGNMISNNLFVEIRHSDPQRNNKGGLAAAVYFDDMLSGNSVINNTFVTCETGVLIGGGRNHLIKGNIFHNVGDKSGGQSVWIDARGLNGPGGPLQNPNCRFNGTFHQELMGLRFTKPPWSTHYPALPKLFAHQDSYSGCEPANNRVLDNICTGNPVSPGRFLVTSPDLGHPIKVMEGWRDDFRGNTNRSGCVLFS